MAVQTLRRLYTVDEYYRMAETGILSPDERVELIDGEVVTSSPINALHAACVDRLTALFTSRLREQVIVRVENPIRLSKWSEPQPDLALLRPRPDFYASGHPSVQDVLLLVEVADTSRRYDRATKATLYERAGIVEMWLVDLTHEVVEVYRNPSTEGYQSVQRLDRGQEVRPISFPSVVIRVEEIVG